MDKIDQFISTKNYIGAIEECIKTNKNYMGILLSNIIVTEPDSVIKMFKKNASKENMIKENVINENASKENVSKENVKQKQIKVKVLCNWTSPENIRRLLNKMSKGNYRWNNIQIVMDKDPDYFVVINAPNHGENPDPSKTIIFQMEPYMDGKNKSRWGKWSNPDPKEFFRVCSHNSDYNNNEWHLSKTYEELKTMKINKTESILSTVLSSKYFDTGHIKRIDFVKFMEKKGMPVHVFGDNKWDYKDFKGSLSPHEKDKGMFPYKYVFNCENNSIKNYYTEKLIDGILSECLVFYSGCYNAREFIDERAFVYLELSNFDDDYKKVKSAIDNNLWEERLPYIRSAKKKILEYLQFFPRLERIINKTENQQY